MLTMRLRNDEEFQNFTLEQQEIFLRMATVFESNSEHLYLSHEELPEHTKLGTKEHWQRFLTLPQTQQYIQIEMKQATQIAQRKAFLALEKQAKDGSVAAAREINELSGIMEKTDNQKIIVLHYVNREGAVN